MWRDSKGFSLIESLIGFAGFVIVISFLIPLLVTMLHHLEQQKTQLTASKLLYQSVETYFYTDKVSTQIITEDSVPFEILFTTNPTNRKEKICVYAKSLETCLENTK